MAEDNLQRVLCFSGDLRYYTRNVFRVVVIKYVPAYIQAALFWGLHTMVTTIKN